MAKNLTAKQALAILDKNLFEAFGTQHTFQDEEVASAWGDAAFLFDDFKEALEVLQDTLETFYDEDEE